jgi:hypothetical protein
MKKTELIVSVNPAWRDLSLEWYERHVFQPDGLLPPAPLTTLSTRGQRCLRAEGSVQLAGGTGAASDCIDPSAGKNRPPLDDKVVVDGKAT